MPEKIPLLSSQIQRVPPPIKNKQAPIYVVESRGSQRQGMGLAIGVGIGVAFLAGTVYAGTKILEMIDRKWEEYKKDFNKFWDDIVKAGNQFLNDTPLLKLWVEGAKKGPEPESMLWLVDDMYKEFSRKDRYNLVIEIYPKELRVLGNGKPLTNLPLTQDDPQWATIPPGRTVSMLDVYLDLAKTLNTYDAKVILTLQRLVYMARYFVVIKSLEGALEQYPLDMMVVCKDGGNLNAYYAVLYTFKNDIQIEVTELCDYHLLDFETGQIRYDDLAAKFGAEGE